jgi:enoyl-CoA hydratase/carnithine racemase
MTEHCTIAHRGTGLEIQLNRADKKNAITSAMYAAMADAMTKAEADPNIRSILFSGAGPAFSSGNDLQDFLSAPMTGDSPVLAFLDALAKTTKVLIAAVHGNCVGIGATLLLHCDHVVAGPSAAIAFSFVKMALVPEAGSSLLLPRAVGRLKAAELFLTGDPVMADEAAQLGLVSKVVREGEQLAAARAFADRLSLLPPEAIRATRALLLSDEGTLLARMAQETAVFRKQLATPEFREAVAAFTQRRAPDFSKAS